MKISLTSAGTALIIVSGVVAVSASTLVSSLTASSALTVGNFSSAVGLARDVTLASDLWRMAAPDRALALSERGLSSETALATRMADTRERIRGDVERQGRLWNLVRYASGFLCASLLIVAFLSIRIACFAGGKKQARNDAAR
ncbi:hypothetical protein LFL96_36935 (plasmid) [Paraburkholderia sp. D15]|uniref:hypothetical protein n=1 Tax=Paraburkholderia sp. D15 TaxID=2880218 RepID=UPI00247A0341|nr:hypothetical protein [Paraburkholderia sp. D15]WGS55065.1 hypothetical protein LFL96_36935 [Paraburkholderia sp. D15]